jgi:hypothetical protein
MAKQALDLVEALPTATGYEIEQQFTLRLGEQRRQSAAR